MKSVPDNSDPGHRILGGVLRATETSDLLRTIETLPLPRGRVGLVT